MCTHKYVKMSQQLKLSNFLKRKSENVPAVECQKTVSRFMAFRFPTLEQLIRISGEGPEVEEYDPAKDLETWFSRERKN